MTLQLIDTTLGAGDTAKAGGDKINAMMREIYSAAFAKPAPATDVIIIPDGDSKGLEPWFAMQHIAFRHRLGILFDGADLHIGSTNTGTGGGTGVENLLNPTRIAKAQTAFAAAKARGVFDYSLKIGINDLFGLTPTQTIMANVRKWHEQYVRPSGARYMLLWAIDPTSTTGPDSGAVNSLNALYKAYADANPQDVIFLNPYNSLIDPASTTSALIGDTSNSATAVSLDGLHLNMRGKYAVGLSAEAQILKLYRQRPLRDLNLGNAYDAIKYRYGNFLGNQGRMSAMGGSGSATGATTAGGTPPGGWALSGSAPGATLTWSVVTSNPALETATGNSGFSVVRLALSGTLTGNMDLRLGRNAFPDSSGIAIGDKLQSGLFVNLNAVAGLLGIGVDNPTTQSTIFGTPIGGTIYPGDTFPTISGLLDIQCDPFTLTAVPGGYGFGFDIYGRSGAVLSGSIDLIVATLGKVGPIPAAAA